MLLTDELAGRIHRINNMAIRGATEAAATFMRDAAWQEIAGGVACFAGEGSPYTQLTEYGFQSEEPALEEIECFFASRCLNWEVTATPFTGSACLKALGRAGYIADHFETVMAAEIGDVAEVPGFHIEEVTGDKAEWMLTAERGWAEQDDTTAVSDVTRISADLAGARLYLAHIDGVPAAVASMIVDDGVVSLSGACTRLPFRGRGLQTALISRRLRDACKGNLVLMTAVPGGPSHRNAQRYGLQPLYSKLVFMRR